jgi:hypothetical protein
VKNKSGRLSRFLGTFHAISFALRDQNPKIFRNFGKELTDVTQLLVDEDNEMKQDRFWSTSTKSGKR